MEQLAENLAMLIDGWECISLLDDIMREQKLMT
jgi:hypothetical protein